MNSTKPQLKPDIQPGNAIEYLSKAEASKLREKKQVVIDRTIDRLYELNGRLNIDILLTEARDQKSEIHIFFEWNDSVAARKYREQQATAILMASKMVVVLRGHDESTRIIHAERVEVRRLLSPYRSGGFKMRNEALNNTEMRNALVEKKIGVLRSWCRETTDYPELKCLRETILGEIEAARVSE